MNIFDKFRLDGKKVFITGGAGGIGKCISIAFAQAGADVAIVDKDIEPAEKTVRELRQYNVKTITVKADVTDPDDVKRMMKIIIAEFGSIDVAVNNAGISCNEKAEEMSYESWKRVIDVNLTGAFLTAQAAGQIMIRQGRGSIINTASMSGHIANRPQNQCVYNASKAGVIMLTKSLAAEWASYNVRVNSISPGYIGTDMTLNAVQYIPVWTELTPVKRMGSPEELQGIFLYLASDASSFTTGSDFLIDGGYTGI